MIICLNARNQENVLSGFREKCITGGCIQGWLGPIYIKFQKQLYEIKIAAFFFILQDLYLNSSGRAKSGSKQAKKIKGNRGVWGCWEPLSDIWGFSQNHT